MVDQPEDGTSPSKSFPSQQWEALNHQLVALDNELHKLVCCYHFYHSAMQALLSQDKGEDAPYSVKWQYGMFVVNDWLNDSGERVLEQLNNILQEFKGAR